MVKAKPLIWVNEGVIEGGYRRETAENTLGRYSIIQPPNGNPFLAGQTSLRIYDEPNLLKMKQRLRDYAKAHADQLVADMAQPVTPQEAARIICDASNEFSPLMYRGWTLHDESGGNGTFWYVFSPEWTSLAPYGFDHPEFAMVSGDYQEAKEAVDRRIASLTTPPQKKEE